MQATFPHQRKLLITVPMKVEISVDRGGTFTDCWAQIPGKGQLIFKLLSENPTQYKDSSAEAVRRVLEIYSGRVIPRESKLDGTAIQSIKMGTTIATNALLEKKGSKFAFVTTEGFEDVLDIGTQARPKLFDLKIKKPEVLYDEVVGIEERVTVETSTDDPNDVLFDAKDPNIKETPSKVPVRIIKGLDSESTRLKLQKLYNKGYRNLAVCLAHAYIYDEHERLVSKIAKEIGFSNISLSSEVSKNINFLKRGNSTCIDAYLTPKVQEYVTNFLSSFESPPDRIQFMQSDGTLIDARHLRGVNAILSGPAGGVIGVKDTCFEDYFVSGLVGFDMGGTSTDVSRITSGLFEVSYENSIAGIENNAPQLPIHTVAAGGGSILKWVNGLFHVGPESAGSYPGPAAYGNGGPLTVTDANLILGRIVVEGFPRVFGPEGRDALDINIVKAKFNKLASDIGNDTGKTFSAGDIALGFLDVANVKMANSIRYITESRGYEVGKHTLVSFGGAGSQNCVAVARNLGISRVIIHRYSSILSAFGISRAKTAFTAVEPYNVIYDDKSLVEGRDVIKAAEKRVLFNLETVQGIPRESVELHLSLSMKYKNSNTSFKIDSASENLEKSFLSMHQREFGFISPNTPICIDSVYVTGVEKLDSNLSPPSIKEQLDEMKDRVQSKVGTNEEFQKVIFSNTGVKKVRVYKMKDLEPGNIVTGPVLIFDETQTILVEPDSVAFILKHHVVLELVPSKAAQRNNFLTEEYENKPLDQADPVLLTVFGHRFMGIAESMGRTLQKASVSTSIKERLDFSCAIFDAEARLCANAPHIPVHLGSMQFAIRYQHERHKDNLRPGDVLLSNHPQAGGTHLPDLTVITPVFHEGELVFYVASRGHHADIGGAGITAMSPNSKELWQEGVSIKSFKLLNEGQFDENGLIKLFGDVAKYPGCSATRNINHNLNDLRAQISANKKGAFLVGKLFEDYGKQFVQYYMRAITYNAELVVRDFFRKEYIKRRGKPLEGSDYFDDGSIVRLKITLCPNGDAFFDFTGTGPETYGPMNTPESITHSCVIYVIRCLINLEIPLNQGCLAPCRIFVPPKSILNPSEFVAICGSTISGQRVTDVILKCFGSVAASQGCANSFGWGRGGKDPFTGVVSKGFAMGEALGGGVGALDGYHGASACNVHCTNTRTTDVEVIEARAPIVVTKWEIRRNSGGKGKWNGGDGAIREIEARVPLRVSILSERRIYAPYGVMGGLPGARGENLWYRVQDDGSFISTKLGGKEIFTVKAFDRVQIRTPGGGGYGLQDHTRSA